MKNKILKISVIALTIMLLSQIVLFAAIDKLTLKTATNKDTYTVGDKVVATLDWTEEMESAGFDVKYDSQKLKFVSLTNQSGEKLSEDFYNAGTVGTITFNWFSMGAKATKIIVTFEAISEGKAVISIENARGFGYTDSNGELAAPSTYDLASGKKEISIIAKQQTPDKNDGNNTQEPNKNNSDKTEQKNPTTTNKDTTSKKDTTTASGKMPQTGAENLVFITVLIAAVGTIGYVKYKKLSDI